MASSKINGVEYSDWARGPTVTGPAWQRVLKAVYNPADKSFLGRTPKRWGIVLVFYAVFYAVLAIMFALCMGGLFLSLDYNKPKYLLEKSLIGANPGLACRPQSNDGIVMKYDRANSSHYEHLITELDDFLKPYDTADFPGCTSNDSYGYPDTPCFFVKLNKIYGWEPEYHDVNSLPAEMPADLVKYIRADDHPAKQQQIWISCEQEMANSSTIEYPWGRGFGSLHYPFLNQAGYRSPLVAVRVTVPPNTLTTFRCRAWAKNIVYNKSIKEPSGHTRIQFHIEDTTSASEDAN